MALLLLVVATTAASAVPAFPVQFVATVETTAHLIAEDSEYPPRTGRKLVFYDLPNKRAKAAILEGLDAGKNYTRRFDLRQDYRERDGRCDRSYLDEDVPLPVAPSGASLDDGVIDGRRVRRFDVVESHSSRSIVSYDAETAFPRRLVNEWKDADSWSPLMTYDLLDLTPVAPAEALFDVPHANCSRWTGGWPRLHLFHHYFRF